VAAPGGAGHRQRRRGQRPLNREGGLCPPPAREREGGPSPPSQATHRGPRWAPWPPTAAGTSPAAPELGWRRPPQGEGREGAAAPSRPAHGGLLAPQSRPGQRGHPQAAGSAPAVAGLHRVAGEDRESPAWSDRGRISEEEVKKGSWGIDIWRRKRKR